MTIIATPGATNSNSYSTLAEANEYHANRLHNAAWTGATDETKESALLWATKLLDANVLWCGYKNDEYQALDWSRYGVIDKNGILISQTVIPQKLKCAQAELAFLLIENDRAMASDPQCSSIKKAKAGSLEIEINETQKQLVLSDSVMTYIQDLGTFSGVSSNNSFSNVHLVRV